MKRPAELNDKDRDILHLPVKEAERRLAVATFNEWKAARERKVTSPWWRVMAYAFWFGLGMLVSAYLTWMAS